MDVTNRNDGLHFNLGDRAILRIPISGDTVTKRYGEIAPSVASPTSARTQMARPQPPYRPHAE